MKEDFEKYKNSNFAKCPLCNSRIIGTRAPFKRRGKDEVTWQMHCFLCGHYWHEIYKMVDIEFFSDEEEK